MPDSYHHTQLQIDKEVASTGYHFPLRLLKSLPNFERVRSLVTAKNNQIVEEADIPSKYIKARGLGRYRSSY